MTGRAQAAATLPPQARAALRAQARPLLGHAGEILVQKGDALSEVFLVIEGTLRVYALTEQGREAMLYRLRPDELCLLSLNTAFTAGQYPANVRVESETAQILRIPGGVIRSLFRQDEAVQDLVLKSLTSAIGDLMLQLDEVLLSPLRDRLLSHLSRNADADGRVVATHQGLAENLGVSREAVSRELVRLRRGRRVATGRGWVQKL